MAEQILISDFLQINFLTGKQGVNDVAKSIQGLTLLESLVILSMLLKSYL